MKCDTKLNYITFKLKWVLKTRSLTIRKNLWTVFVRSYYVFLLPFFSHIQMSSHQDAVQKFINKYIRRFSCLKMNAFNFLGPLLTGINLRNALTIAVGD